MHARLLSACSAWAWIVKYFCWGFPQGCFCMGLLIDFAGFYRIEVAPLWTVQESCHGARDIKWITKEPSRWLWCLPAYLLETSTRTFFCEGKRTVCFQRSIMICPLRVHWRIFFRVIIFHWDKKACRILDVVRVLEESQLVNKLSFCGKSLLFTAKNSARQEAQIWLPF